MTLSKWDFRFLEMAQLVASWSKDNTKVGAVIADEDNRIVGMGYNGLPRGSGFDDIENVIRENREKKWAMTIHAEENAYMFSSRSNLKGCTIYVTMPICGHCMSQMVQLDLRRAVVYDKPEVWKPYYSFNNAIHAGVDVAAAGKIIYDVVDPEMEHEVVSNWAQAFLPGLEKSS